MKSPFTSALLPFIACVLAGAGQLRLGAEDQDSSARARGREHCQLFYDGELDALWERFAPALRAVFDGDPVNLEAFHSQVWSQLGGEVEVVSERVQDLPDGEVYVRTARFSNAAGTFEFLWQFAGERTITALSIAPTRTEAPSRFLEYRTKTPLRLPFVDTWDVFWGGRSIQQNYHTAYPDQRFAYDFLVFEEGRTHRGEGKSNADYHCFGLRIVSPGAGTVVAAANDVEDNVPGVMNPAQALGNHVIIDHGNREFSFLAHFREGTVQVAEGDRVEAGQDLGLAGNSGNTSEPHLHYHLQTTRIFNLGEGLPTQFLNYVADDAPVARGEPVKGQRIRPAERD